MTRGVDFQRLYHEFGLDPEAGFDELRLAYRRRVSVLHPDRMDAADPISQDLANQHLQRLTTLYEAAARFHRQHGRLPGAAANTRVDPPAARPAPERKASSDAAPAVPTARSWRSWIPIALPVAVVLILWLVFALDETDHAGTAATSVAPAAKSIGASARVAGPQPGAGIHVGMSESDVARILGEPVMRESTRWDYGPSWVRFSDGKVEEWYSSPLRSLRVAKAPPATPATEQTPQPSQD